MIPIAGSAYTYAYATLGEFVAWIIGWDLILEYALGAATVAVGWSGLRDELPRAVRHRHPAPVDDRPVPDRRRSRTGRWSQGIFNLPAVLIVLVVTAILIVGIRESASFNSDHRVHRRSAS